MAKYHDHPQFSTQVKQSVILTLKSVADSILAMTDPSSLTIQVVKQVIEDDVLSVADLAAKYGVSTARAQEAFDLYNHLKAARPLATAIKNNW